MALSDMETASGMFSQKPPLQLPPTTKTLLRKANTCSYSDYINSGLQEHSKFSSPNLCPYYAKSLPVKSQECSSTRPLLLFLCTSFYATKTYDA